MSGTQRLVLRHLHSTLVSNDNATNTALLWRSFGRNEIQRLVILHRHECPQSSTEGQKSILTRQAGTGDWDTGDMLPLATSAAQLLNLAPFSSSN